MADALTHIRAEEEEDRILAGLGKRWIYNFLNRNPDLAAGFPIVRPARQSYRRLARSPVPGRDSAGYALVCESRRTSLMYRAPSPDYH